MRVVIAFAVQNVCCDMYWVDDGCVGGRGWRQGVKVDVCWHVRCAKCMGLLVYYIAPAWIYLSLSEFEPRFYLVQHRLHLYMGVLEWQCSRATRTRQN